MSILKPALIKYPSGKVSLIVTPSPTFNDLFVEPFIVFPSTLKEILELLVEPFLPLEKPNNVWSNVFGIFIVNDNFFIVVSHSFPIKL